jgi:hypothetical protein
MAPSGTSIQAHIATFTSRLQDLNYNLDEPLPDIDVNVAFLASLGSTWQTFQQSMGERVNTLKPAQLYAEVLAFESQRDRTEMAEKAIGNGFGNGIAVEELPVCRAQVLGLYIAVTSIHEIQASATMILQQVTCSLAFGELGPNLEAGGNNEELFELWHTSRCGLSCGF